MKNLPPIFLSSLSFLVFFACKKSKALLPQEPSTENMATIRDNYVDLVLMDGIRNFRFKSEDIHCITDGQPWAGLSSYPKNKSYKMKICAGRKKSKKVALWFSKNVENGNTCGCDTFSLKPQELNFAIKGTIHFEHEEEKYTVHDVVLGQGNTGGLNNWWIGGKQMLRVDLDYESYLIQLLNSKSKPDKLIKLRIETSMSHSNVHVFYLKIIKD